MNTPSLVALRIVLALAGAFTVYAGFNKALGGIHTLGWQGESRYIAVTNQHRCVAFYQPATRRTSAACVPKGLPAFPADIGRANPPASDGPGADATNPRCLAGLLVPERGQLGAERERAAGWTLAGDRGRPRIRARAGAGRSAGRNPDGSAPVGADAERTGPAGRGRRPDRAERGDGKARTQRPQHSAPPSYPRRLLTAVARSSAPIEARGPSS
jgi:hypothetical protein